MEEDTKIAENSLQTQENLAINEKTPKKEFQVIWDELFPRYLTKVEEAKALMKDMSKAPVANAILYGISHPFLEKYMKISEKSEPDTKRLFELFVEINDIKLTLAIYSRVAKQQQEMKNE
jgi:hypothetical protein